MEFEEKRYSLESGIAKGRPLPQWALDEPDVFPGDYFYISAFHDLGTCRNFGMTVGPIPWTEIIKYAEFHKLEDSIVLSFVNVIREMDSAYLKKISPES